MTIKFNNAFFITSSLSAEDSAPILSTHGLPLPEVAFVGRSNVGKSSLINHLVRRKTLARVSTKPGKTQTLNFFNVDNALCLVDLPGYGFAKVPQAMKKQWAQSIDYYLRTRKSLKLLVLLLDARHLPTEEDLQLILWAHAYKKPLIIVLTKSDKLSTKERNMQKKEIRASLEALLPMEEFSLLSYSIKNSHMRQVLINAINESLA